MIKQTIVATLVCTTLAFGAPGAATAGPLGACVQGAIVGSFLTWTTAVILAPFTGGASLAAAPTVDLMLAGGAAGCVLSATGAHAAEAVEDAMENPGS